MRAYLKKVFVVIVLPGNVVNGPIGKQMVDTFFESSANFEVRLLDAKLLVYVAVAKCDGISYDQLIKSAYIAQKSAGFSHYALRSNTVVLKCCRNDRKKYLQVAVVWVKGQMQKSFYQRICCVFVEQPMFGCHLKST